MTGTDLGPALARRLVAPVLLVFLAAAAVAAGAIHLGGEDRRLTGRTGQEIRELRELRTQLDRRRNSRAFIGSKLPLFADARDKGFLTTPDDLEASVLIEELAAKHQLADARYQFGEPRRIRIGQPGDAFAASFVALPIALDVKALFDEDLFMFLNAFARQLDGYALVRSLRITRTQGDIGAVAGRVARGERPNVVSATVELAWVALQTDEPWDLADPEDLDVEPVSAEATRPDPLILDFVPEKFVLSRSEAQAIRDALQVAEADAHEPARPEPQAPTESNGEADGEAEPPPPLMPVYLAALFYFGPDNWSFWLDGERFSPGDPQAGFEVIRVTPGAVTLNWNPADREADFTFTLSPRQSFDPARGEVVEGRLPGRASASPTGTDGRQEARRDD